MHVLLQVNVGVSFMSDSVLEVLQYEKYRADATIQVDAYEFNTMSNIAFFFNSLLFFFFYLLESRLFFKQQTSWRPRVSRDLMISVASEMSEQAPGSKGGASKLPVQVCRYCQQQPEKSKCFICETLENLWICVICGFVGCGMYKEGHAIRHWKETHHC